MKKIFINSIIATVMLFNFSIANVFANDEHNPYDIITTQNGIIYELWSDGSFTSNSVKDIFSKAKKIKIPNSISYNNKTYEIDMLFFEEINGKYFTPEAAKTCKSLSMDNADIFRGIFKWNKLKEIKATNIYTYFGDIKNCKNLKNIFVSGYKQAEALVGEISDNKNLESITFKNIYQIETNAVHNCPKLQSIILSGNIGIIDAKAFYNCKSLSKVIFKNVKKLPNIDKNAFKNTNKGIKFVVKNKKVAKLLKKKLKGSGVKNAKILIGKKVVYQNING